jgi:2-polyprenyl-6-methoxyphenol hydroxylase-like FAD-dependent oxidoreductase
MSNKHAIIIGGSITGLLAARVLANFFDKVTVIERDHLPENAAHRNGVPQAHHLHVLLARGFQIIEQLFPGMDLELEAAGAPSIHWGKESVAYLPYGWTPIFESSVRTRGVSRTLLEWLIRKRLLTLPPVRIMAGYEVEGLSATANQTQVTGVIIRSRSGARETESLTADLVVDATGRSSHAPEWLEMLGYDKPQETEVNSFLGYATRWYKRPIDFPRSCKGINITAQAPNVRRGGVFLEVENDQWIVTLAGVNKDYPPTDEVGFLSFVSTLASPALYEAIKNAEPISAIYGYQRTANRWRHFERLSRWPEQFIVMGDAACAFNPVYGQGMTTGALEALALEKLLVHWKQPTFAGFARKFQNVLAQVVAVPWLMATGEDLRYPGTIGGKVGLRDRIIHRYFNALFRIMPNNPDVLDAFFQVMNLLKPPAMLFHPPILFKVVLSLVSRPEPARQESPIQGMLTSASMHSSFQ